MSAQLQLWWTPRTVTVTPVERTPLAAGECLPLSPSGRSIGAGAELQVSAPQLPKVLCRLSPRDGGWWLSHPGPGLRCLVNGAAFEEGRLQHLDVLELPGHGPVFRFLSTPPPHTSPVAPDATLDDEARLAVWADALQDAQDPLGERVARALSGTAPTPADDLRWLGPLSRPLLQGRLEVEWRHGLVRSAVWRNLAPYGPEPLSSLEALLRLPAARFLQALTLDAGGAQSNATAFVEALQFARGHRTLQRLSFGDCWYADTWVEPLEQRLVGVLKPLFPALVAGRLFGRFKRATLVTEPGGEVWTLGDADELIDAAPGHQGTSGVAAWALRRQHAHWELSAVTSAAGVLRLNGRLVEQAMLRDGDLIQLAGGASRRFRLER